MTPRREGKDPRGPFPDLPKTKKTDLWSADLNPQTIHFPSRKYRKNLTADKLGKRCCRNSDGKNYCTAQRWCYTTDICTEPSPAAGYPGCGNRAKAHFAHHFAPGHSSCSLHASLHPVFKQASCSGVCAFSISLHCIEPTVDNR